MAFIVRSIEYVEVSITAASEPVTVNLTKGQDPAKCVPRYSVRNTGTITDQHQDRLGEVEIVDNAGTPAVRVSASARLDPQTTIFQVFVEEYNENITVQQVDVTGFTGTSVNVPINDVTAQSRAFLIYSYQYTSPPASDDDWNDAAVQVRFNGASTTSVTLSRRASGGTCNGTLYVVEAENAEFIVDHREIDVTGSTATSGTDTISATVLADTFLVHSYETSEAADDMRDGAWVADLQDTTTVRVRRTNAGSPSATSTHSIAVVEAQGSEWDVQRNDALTLSSASVTDSITAIDEARSTINVLDHSGHPFSVGRNNSTQGNSIDDIQSAADFSANNLVRFRKRTTTITNDIVSYEVIQFVLNPVTITDVETDEEFDDKDTAITITGTDFEATKGTGKVELASGSDYAAATKIEQTTTSWADTAIDFTVDLSTLTPGTLYLFVTNNSAGRNDAFPVTVHRAIAFVLAASPNIAASGENTTFQLTAPAGKATTDFDAGRIQDDENPADAVDVTIDDYTEFEWCIEATTNAEDSGVYQFRVVVSDDTVFDTYSVDPRWTISAAGEISQVPAGDLNFNGLIPSGVTTENRFSDLALGALAFTGLVPLILVTEIATVPAGNLSFTGQTPSAIVSELSQVPAGDLSFNGFVPTIVTTEGRFSDLPVGDLSFNGQVPTLVATDNRFSNVPAGDLNFTGFVPTLVATDNRFSNVPAGDLSFTGLVPTVVTTEGETSQLPAGDLSFNGLIPTLVATDDRFSNVPVGDLSFTGFVPTVVATSGETSLLPVADLSFTGFVPTVVTTENRFSDLPVGDLSFNGQIPAALVTDISQVPLGDLSFAGLVPTIITTEGDRSQLPTGDLSFTGFAPDVLVSDDSELPVGVLSFTGFVMQFETTAEEISELPVADLSFAGLIPSAVTTEHRVSNIPAGNLVFGGLIPTLTATENRFVNLPTGSLILAGQVPTFDRSTGIVPPAVLVLHETRTIRVSSEGRSVAVLGDDRIRKLSR